MWPLLNLRAELDLRLTKSISLSFLVYLLLVTAVSLSTPTSTVNDVFFSNRAQSRRGKSPGLPLTMLSSNLTLILNWSNDLTINWIKVCSSSYISNSSSSTNKNINSVSMVTMVWNKKCTSLYIFQPEFGCCELQTLVDISFLTFLQLLISVWLQAQKHFFAIFCLIFPSFFPFFKFQPAFVVHRTQMLVELFNALFSLCQGSIL